MTCGKFEERLCDYVDATLRVDDRRQLEDHAAGCSACAGKLADATWAVGFLRNVPAVEPPAELVADILHGTAAIGGEILAPAGAGSGWTRGWLGPLFNPLVQPRFAMSMAMALLSFSMITYSGEQALQSWRSSRTGPVAVAQQAGVHLNRAWTRGMEIYEIVRDSYRIDKAAPETPAGPGAEQQDKNGAQRQEPR
jgi:anti-sigma factor RsiW